MREYLTIMKLSDDEQEVLRAEVGQALGMVRGPELKVAYARLLEAIETGEVPEELLGPLQHLLEVGLESGRIRRVHTAHGEMAAQHVYARTPAGIEVRQAVEEANSALRALQGQVLEELTVAPAGPGTYTLSVATDQGKLLLRVDRRGVRLQSLEVGG